MNTPAPERPMPTPTRESKPYWDGLREGRFMLQHCAACGKVRHYPRPVCPHCFSMESIFKEAAQGGESVPKQAVAAPARAGTTTARWFKR